MEDFWEWLKMAGFGLMQTIHTEGRIFNGRWRDLERKKYLGPWVVFSPSHIMERLQLLNLSFIEINTAILY